MENIREVDVAIIGAGSAGLSARRQVVKETTNYVVIDDGILGTTCARVGCMPSKVLIQAANDFYRKNQLLEQGIHGGENLSVSIPEVMKHVRKLRDRFVRAVDSGMSTWVNDSTLLRKRAKFIDAHTLDLNGEKITAKKVIIATGSKPNIPGILKEYRDFLLTTDEVFEQEDLPQNIAVIGLGVIGIELGQALHRLGLNVFGIARREMIAGVSDPKIREYVVRKMAEEMNLSFTGLQSVEKVGNQLKLKTKDKEFLADKILITSGRAPNLGSLNLGSFIKDYQEGVVPAFSKDVFNLIDYPHIFLPGDVNGNKQILHEASDEGNIAGLNAVSSTVVPFQTRTPLEVTFCDPQIAKSGMSYEEVVSSGIEFEIGEVSFEGQGRSIVKLKEIGLLRVYGNKKTGELLGAEMFGPENEHIAHLLSWVISQKMTVNQVLSLPFYHPVIEEGLRTALRNLRDKSDEKMPNIELYTK